MNAFFKSMIFAVLLSVSAGTVSFADTVVTTTTTRDPYFHSYGGNPLSAIFYFVGDVVSLPFDFLGNLFNGTL